MLRNDQMKAGRFLKLHRGRRLLSRMAACWNAGGTVQVVTCTRVTNLAPKHRDFVEMGRSGSLYMRRGKARDCLDFCGFAFTA